MIQQKPATDEALVERARRAVANGDETMKPILEWDARGRKPKDYGTEWHHKATEVVRNLKQKHPVNHIAPYFGLNEQDMYFILNKNYPQVSDEKAKKVASYDGGMIAQPPEGEISPDDYRKAQEILRKDHETMEYKEIAEKYGLPYRRVWNMIKDQYSNPNPAAWKVLSTQDNAIT